jgi:uncharacterized membrane protein
VSQRLARLQRRYRHPVNQMMMEQSSTGEHIADLVAGFLGSWRFIVIQTVLVTIWISGNVWLLFHFDPYPFILLNLAFSTQAAYAAPLILLAANRSSVRDRMTLEHAAENSDKEDLQNQELLRGNTEILKRVEALEEKILDLERAILDALPRPPS